MKKWEYLILGESSTEELNELGQQGWELVNVCYAYTGKVIITLKREIII